jgi:hypothetical protein
MYVYSSDTMLYGVSLFAVANTLHCVTQAAKASWQSSNTAASITVWQRRSRGNVQLLEVQHVVVLQLGLTNSVHYTHNMYARYESPCYYIRTSVTVTIRCCWLRQRFEAVICNLCTDMHHMHRLNVKG